MSKKVLTTVALTAALVSSAAATISTANASADNMFSMQEVSGQLLAEHKPGHDGHDSKCGKGMCGAAKDHEKKDGEHKCAGMKDGEHKCAGMKKDGEHGDNHSHN
ncbi:MAG: low-complexity protein [Cyanobacteria bacterium P01_H01_bin.74]